MIPAVVVSVGVLLMLAGLWWAWPPAALIVAGLLMVVSQVRL